VVNFKTDGKIISAIDSNFSPRLVANVETKFKADLANRVLSVTS
jgi:hypothetical protein